MNISKHIWLFIILVLLACSSWYFARSPSITTPNPTQLAQQVDTTIYQLHLRQFDEHGELINALSTPLVNHIPYQDTHVLKTPNVYLTQGQQTPWHIHAKQAISKRGGEIITFMDHVIIDQLQPNHKTLSTLKTEKLVYLPHKQLATTDANVVYERAGNIVQSTGMKVYLAEKRVKLLSKAQGVFNPSHG